jgi:hypothetical protein
MLLGFLLEPMHSKTAVGFFSFFLPVLPCMPRRMSTADIFTNDSLVKKPDGIKQRNFLSKTKKHRSILNNCLISIAFIMNDCV